MKKQYRWFHAFLLILVFSTPLIGQEAILNGPQITFEKVIHDYGTIEQSANGNCVFSFSNTGNGPLIISQVKNSCGCIVPSWSKDPIPPGGTGYIKVKYDTKRVGSINKSLTVVTNAVNTPQVVIRVKGKVLPRSTQPPIQTKTGVNN